jgi:hypothetical protein
MVLTIVVKYDMIQTNVGFLVLLYLSLNFEIFLRDGYNNTKN